MFIHARFGRFWLSSCSTFIVGALVATSLVSCTAPHMSPASLTQPIAATTPAGPWWKFITHRRAILQAHLQTDPTPPWLAPAGNDSSCSLDIAGVSRTYLLHVPPAYDGKTPLPLIVAL